MMDSKQWDRVQEILASVADLPKNQQRAAVSTACGSDKSLEQEVLELLEEDASSKQSPLDSGLDAIAGRFLETDFVRSLVQYEIGPYRLLRLLGEGGMGVVYLAERTDIGGLVAIKVLRDAWMSPMRRDRFLAEQRTLARLHHHSIAHIYDAGTMKNGTPWFVMEFADGLPITEYIQSRHASTSETLLTFRAVCEAVQYAHGLAVIHRDLKPSNILVTKSGEVKLLDFGIAKTLDDEGADRQRTMDGLRLMSLDYAAPEQRSGESVGVFTDIYALGVLLYELLTGRLPAREAAPDRSFKYSLTAWAYSAPDAQKLDLYQWADLDSICATALQPDPEQRYRSADALARDIQAYLEGRPLEGRRDKLWYTTGKFVRRHRVFLINAASVLALFAATAVIFTVRLANARNAALAEAAKANRILSFTEELFDGGDSQAGPHMSLKVTDMLDRGKAEALNLPADTPLKPELLTMLGTAYGKLGQVRTADDLLEQAVKGNEALPALQQDEFAKSQLAMAELRRQERRLPGAESLLHQVITRCEREHCNKNLVERAHADLGSVLAIGGNYPQAKAELNMAVSLHAAGEPSDTQLAEDLTQLGEVDHYLGSYDAAEALNQKALAINLSLRGKDHPAVAENLNNLSAIAMNRAQYQKADSLQREALTITQNWYGPDHPAVADALSALSSILIAQDKLDEAEAVLTRALGIQERVYGQQHASVALIYNELGTLASRREQLDTAEKDYRSAMAIWQTVYGPEHQFVALAYTNLASVYVDRKSYVEAESLCRKALAIYASALPGQNVNAAVAHLRLGRIFMHEGKFQDAEPETRAGYQFFASHDASSVYLGAARKDLAKIENALGHTESSAHDAGGISAPR